jgi:tRNA (guanine-N7-)-methyltransferase
LRIRTKTWARPELKACDYFIGDPASQRDHWAEFFSRRQPLHLDLGCGKCTFLAELAYQNQEINYIGVDISPDILGVARRNITARFDPESVRNVALVSYNIEKLTELFGEEEKAERIYINFCNPWPKARCHKRRLTHTRQLESYKKILAPGGELWFKTDNDDLFLATQRYLGEAGFEILSLTHDLNALPNTGNILSEHEVMFEAQGIKTKALKARLAPSPRPEGNN